MTPDAFSSGHGTSSRGGLSKGGSCRTLSDLPPLRKKFGPAEILPPGLSTRQDGLCLTSVGPPALILEQGLGPPETPRSPYKGGSCRTLSDRPSALLMLVPRNQVIHAAAEPQHTGPEPLRSRDAHTSSHLIASLREERAKDGICELFPGTTSADQSQAENCSTLCSKSLESTLQGGSCRSLAGLQLFASPSVERSPRATVSGRGVSPSIPDCIYDDFLSEPALPYDCQTLGSLQDVTNLPPSATPCKEARRSVQNTTLLKNHLGSTPDLYPALDTSEGLGILDSPSPFRCAGAVDSKAEHVGIRSPGVKQHPPTGLHPRPSNAHQSNAAHDTCQVTGTALTRAQRGRSSSHAPPASSETAAPHTEAADSSQMHFTSFDLAAGATVLQRQETWHPDACVRRAITSSQVPDPIGRLIRANVPGWPVPQAVVSLGSRFYTHVPCVLVFQSEPHVPLVVEVLPWETPAQLIRFAPPHMGLVGAESCWINGYQADCRHRLPPDTDWVELRVTPLTAHEATLCAAAFARLPRDAEPRLPRSWTAAGYFPKHGFPAGVFADVFDPTAAEFLPCPAPDIPSSSSSEAYFSSSHSGSPDCARASFPTRPSHPPHSMRQPTRRTMGPLQGSTTAQASTANMHAWRNFTPTTPPIPGPQRRWGRHGAPRELGDIAIALDAGEAEMTVFDPVLHVRVILGDRLAIGTDPVQFALAKSPYLPAGFAGRILRYPVEGYPGPQVVLSASEADGFRTAPVDLQGDSRRICTLAFPAHASVFELTLQLTEHCQAPSTLRFQVARRHAPVEVNGLRAPQFEADTLVDADVVQIRNIRQHWTPRGRPDLLALQESLGTVTPELLLPLRVRRSFTHPVCSVVVHRVGLPHQCVSYDP